MSPFVHVQFGQNGLRQRWASRLEATVTITEVAGKSILTTSPTAFKLRMDTKSTVTG
jgi:hypothetical protein